MDHFNYKNGKLFAEQVDVANIAGEVGTPVYIYSKATFLDHLRKVQAAYTDVENMICYSIKACGNINILKFLAEAGSGFDVVSGGELYRAQSAGADCSKIVYAGVGKTDAEIIEALNAQIGCFNIESEAELENLIELAKKRKKTTKATLRVNPDVDPQTHTYTATGKKGTKFGVDIERARQVFGFSIEALNIGGGYGADYETHTAPLAGDYASAIIPLLKGRNLKLILEPGASIAANSAILLTRVLYVKTGGEKKFVIVDAGMNDLIRPPLYNAFHFIWPTDVDKRFVLDKRERQPKIDGLEVVDVVGPICEAADFFAHGRTIPPVKRGDLISIFTAGAYGYTMSSNYNARPLLAEVLVDGDKFTIIRKRQTYEDLVGLERGLDAGQ
jgi:diaminopimelate decarboxylase